MRLVLHSPQLIYLADITLAPKKDVEVLARQYHAWGFANTKILDALRLHFDANIYGLGSVRLFSD